MPASRAASYKKWKYNFVTYWGIEDNNERQRRLLNYFIDCGVIEPHVQSISLDTMIKICDDDFVRNPFKLGSKSVHLEKNLHFLRQCVTAEMLLICGVEKHNIKKSHVVHKADPLKEKLRWEEITRMSNQVDFSCAMTPHSKFLADQRAKKKSKVIQNANLHNKPYSIVTQNSAEIPCKNDLNSDNNYAFSRSVISPKRAMKNPSSPYNLPAFFNQSDVEIDIQDQTNHHIYTYALDDLARNKTRSKKTSINSNPLIATVGAKWDISHVVAVTPPKKNLQRISTSAVNANNNVEQSVPPNRDDICEENLNHDLTRSFILSGLRRVSDIQNDSSDSHDLETTLLTHHLMNNSNNNQDAECPLESILSENSNYCEDINDNTLPSNDGGETALLFGKENKIKKYGLKWSTSQDEVKIKHDTISRKAKALLNMLHDLTGGDIATARAVFQNLQTRFQSCCALLPDEKLLKVNENDDKNECNVDKAIVNNIERFIALPQNRTKGKRKTQLQQVLLAILTSIVGPSYGYCSTPFGEGEIISIDKSRRIYTIKFPWGATMYCHQIEMEKYNCTGFLSLSMIAKKLGLKDRHILYTCRELRNSMASGQKQPFEKMVTKPKTPWNNFGLDIQHAIHSFCHDPDYVRPDNYHNKKYSCTNDIGELCKHQRQNWSTNGNIEVQYDLFFQSTHFAVLVHSIQDRYPEKSISEEYIKKKISLKTFKKHKSNCVREETRASCVDPIEARCYDCARALQLLFRGISSTRPKIRSYYLQEHSSMCYYDPYIDACNSDESDDEVDAEKEEESEKGNFVSHHHDASLHTANMNVDDVVVGMTRSTVDSAEESLLVQFQDCRCKHCVSGNSWLQIFERIRNGRPHIELLKMFLCPRIMYPDLNVDGENPFFMHRWECGVQTCNHCRLETSLPFECPMTNSDHPVKLWVWDKATGDNERTMKVEKKMRDVFQELRISLITFSQHSIALQLFNRQRYLNLKNLDYNKAQICTDFSSQLNLEPIRKVTSHVNEHASLGIFCVFFKSQMVFDDESISYIDCHEWFVFGGCNESGKKNDWIFHNAAINYILKFYTSTMPQLQIWDVWTDNGPGQYKNRQNFFQCAKKTLNHSNVQEFNHNFAKQHGFKNKSDTIGHWIKQGIRQLEADRDYHAYDALRVYNLAEEYINFRPSKFERIFSGDKKNMKKALVSKSPYECTKRFAAYMEDDMTIYQKLRKNVPGGHFIFSDRDRMKHEEDTRPIENTHAYYSFCHSKDDDNSDVRSFLPIPRSETGQYLCRFCNCKYKTKKPFEAHEKFCKLSIETGKAHRIRFKYFKCFCKKCREGGGQSSQCMFKDISGEEQSKWLLSNADYQEIEEMIGVANDKASEDAILESVKEAMGLLFSKYNHDYPTVPETNCGMKRSHWCALVDICNLNVSRLDNARGSPRVMDMQAALEKYGGWKKIVQLLEIQEP